MIIISQTTKRLQHLTYHMVPTAKEIIFSRIKLPFPRQRKQDLRLIHQDMCEKAYI